MSIWNRLFILRGKKEERARDLARKILGIDLGTSNSCIAVIEGGKPVVIPNAEGARITPSVVALTAQGEWLVGEPAKRQAMNNPRNTVFSVKRLMGRKYDEIDHEFECLPYEIVKAQNGDAHVKMGHNVYSPPEISAVILQKLKMDAEAYLGEELTQAIITVPSYFNNTQRKATKDAARIAGLQAVRFINESTAACMAYGLDRNLDEIAAVVHFGGGTFDVSILAIGNGVYEVLSTTGDTHLGGDDIDWNVIEWLKAEFKNEHRMDLTCDPIALQRLKEAVEKAKCHLSSAHQAEINLPFIAANQSGPKHMTATLTREKLEELSGPLLERLAGPVTMSLRDTRCSREGEVGHVVLAGAMTRMPKVQELTKNLFGRKPYKGVDPEEVVAIGAAIQSGVLAGDFNDMLLLDVTPISLGIETLGGVFTKQIERNTTIPTKQSDIFTTAFDNQTSVEIHVLQGESEMARDNRTIGRFHLDGIPPVPRGIPQIEVTFDIDANSFLDVSAKDIATGKEQKVRIESSSGLTEKEIIRAVKESEGFSQQYRMRHRIAQDPNAT